MTPEEFLLGLLSRDREIPSQRVIRCGIRKGFSRSQIESAAKIIEVIRKRKGFGSESSMSWRLPPNPLEIRMAELEERVKTLEKLLHRFSSAISRDINQQQQETVP